MSMSGKLRKSKVDPHRPFDPAIVREAKAIADRYQLVIWKEDGHYYGCGVELPNSFGDGKTIDACASLTREAFIYTVATLLEHGKKVPPPAIEEIRTEQINVRLTSREKLQLETTAGQKGFKGVSDYVRSAVLLGK